MSLAYRTSIATQGIRGFHDGIYTYTHREHMGVQGLLNDAAIQVSVDVGIPDGGAGARSRGRREKLRVELDIARRRSEEEDLILALLLDED